jgi:hypothetical protein
MASSYTFHFKKLFINFDKNEFGYIFSQSHLVTLNGCQRMQETGAEYSRTISKAKVAANHRNLCKILWKVSKTMS